MMTLSMCSRKVQKYKYLLWKEQEDESCNENEIKKLIKSHFNKSYF